MIKLYHITHIKNLPSIVLAGGLHCDDGRLEHSLKCIGIAHQNIKDRRANRSVPVAQFGTLAHYVPFYFAPRSPMLYAIHRNCVEHYTGGQGPIVHLVSTAEAVSDANLPFAFTDGHAEMAVSEFFENLSEVNDKIDWPVMKSKFWNDIPDHPDRKRKRQAEFLVHQFFPWTLIKGIGVIDGDMEQEVGRILAATEHQPVVRVARAWYYD